MFLDSIPPGKTYSLELKVLLERANAGDETVFPELKQAFDRNPELVAIFGDLVQHAEQALLSLVAGRNLAAKEAISRQSADLRARLLTEATSELEKLLVDRVVLCWVSSYFSDIDVTHHLLTKPGDSPATTAAERRLGQANARFLAAVRTLATVRKLLQKAPSPIQIATRLEKRSSRPSMPKRDTLLSSRTNN